METLIVDWQKMIFEEIANPRLHRRQVAYTYRMIMERVGSAARWGDINRAIIARWSVSGLEWIKRQAHSGKCFEGMPEVA